MNERHPTAVACIQSDAAPAPPACHAAGNCSTEQPLAMAHARLVELWRTAVEGGATCARASAALHVRPRTLRHWRRRLAAGESSRPRGRPGYTLGQPARQALLASLRELGPGIGVSTLKARFPAVPRRHLAQFKHRYRRIVNRWRRRHLARLEWTRPGAVWAMDHAQPPLPINGKYSSILSVRDLATGHQLAWNPLRNADADTTVTVLVALFEEYGPPLVLKSDNGKALTQGGVPELLARHGVTPLVSPPYRPQYNGGCEAGVRAMKVRTEDLAFVDDRARHWTAADLDHALRIANEIHRGGLAAAPTRAQRWRDRVVPASAERSAFQAAVAAQRQRLADQTSTTTNSKPSNAHQRKLDRQSVALTLVESGLLIIHRRPNTPDNNPQNAARIM